MPGKTVYYQFYEPCQQQLVHYPMMGREQAKKEQEISILSRIWAWIEFILSCVLFLIRNRARMLTQLKFVQPVHKAAGKLFQIKRKCWPYVPVMKREPDRRGKLIYLTRVVGNLSLASQNVAQARVSNDGLREAANMCFMINFGIDTAIEMINKAAILFVSVFLNIRLATSNIVFTLSLLDYIVRSIAMLQYSVSVFIYGSSFTSKFLAKLRSNP